MTANLKKPKHLLKRFLKSKAICFVLIGLSWIYLLIPYILFNVFKSQISSSVYSSNSSLHKQSDFGVCNETFTELADVAQLSHNDSTILSHLLSAHNNVIISIESLNFDNASEECVEEVVKFLCLNLIIMCNESETNVIISQAVYLKFNDEACTSELSELNGFNISTLSSLNTCNNRTAQETGNIFQTEVLNCSELFYYDNISKTCNPDCYLWRSLERSGQSATLNRLVIASVIIGLIGLITFVIIPGLRRKNMFAFPAVIVVYIVLDYIILDTIIIVTLIGQGSLYCESQNFLKHPPIIHPFCAFASMIFSYLILQSLHWIFTFVFNVFWTVNFPIRYQQFKEANKVKYLHAASVFFGFLVPLIPVMTAILVFNNKIHSNSEYENTSLYAGGFGYSGYLYTSGHLVATCYLACGFPLGLFILHKLIKRSSEKSITLGTPEKKVLLGCLIIFIVSLAINIESALTAGRGHQTRVELQDFFICEQNRYKPDTHCNLSAVQNNNSVTEVIADICFGIFQIFVLVYALDVQELRKKLKIFCSKFKQLHTSMSA